MNPLSFDKQSKSVLCVEKQSATTWVAPDIFQSTKSHSKILVILYKGLHL